MLSQRATHHTVRFSTLQSTFNFQARHFSNKNVSFEGSIKPTVASLLASRKLEGAPQNENVTVDGFVRTIRKQKKHAFAVIGDGSTAESLQILIDPAKAESLTTGSALRISGKWQASPAGKQQSQEILASDIKILGDVDPATYPLQKKYHTPEYLRTVPHFRTRTIFNSLMLQLRSQSISSISKFFEARGFVQTHPPIITSSDCEGAGEVFSITSNPADEDHSPTKSSDPTSTIPFFNTPKYLTVSSQLHLEALAQSLTRVWTLSPTFRAERSDTARHLSEFYMLEAELAFTDSLSDITNLLESLLRNLAFNLSLSSLGKDLLSSQRYDDTGSPLPISQTSNLLSARWAGLMAPDWPRITYNEAIKLLQASTEAFSFPPSYGSGLQAEHERYLADEVGKGSPVFVTDYPAAIKPFYMASSSSSSPSSSSSLSSTSASPTPETAKTVANFDLLLPSVLEVAGGSLREHRYDALVASMRAHGLTKRKVVGPDGVHDTQSRDEEDLGSLQWYADLRKWGSVPHGGFGLGFDRLLGYLAGVPNIREVVTFPRWVGRCDC